MFLQLSLSFGDFMKKGNVFTTVFIVWRLDGKKGMFLQLSLSFVDLMKKEMFLQLSLSSGALMKKRKRFYNCLYLL